MQQLLNTLKSRQLLATVLAIAAFAVISWLYFYPDDVMGNVLRQADMQQGAAIGQEAKAYEAATGETTRWTNSLFGGMPTFQINPSYQSTSLLAWVNKLLSLGFPSPVNLLFVMMLGFFLLMRALGTRTGVAALGAVAYAFSSYFIILIGAGHIWKYVTLAYIPPTIAGIVWAYRGRVLAGAATAALFAAVQLSWNHVQMTYYFLFVILALAIAYLTAALRDKTLRQWATATCALAAAALLAVCANAPSLYNTYKYSKETIRGGHSELTAQADGNSTGNTGTNGGLDKDYITAWSYGKAETLTLLVPNVAGGATIKPEKGQNRFLSLADTKQAQDAAARGDIDAQTLQFMQQFPQYFGDQPMTNGPVYVGALILALFIIGCATVRGPVKWALLAMTLFSILLSWGHNMMWLTDLMIDHMPMYNKFRTVASILVIAELTMPALAMLALEQMLTQPDWLKRHRRAFCYGLGACLGLCLLIWLVPGLFSLYSESERQQIVGSGLMQQYPTVFMAIENVRKAVISADALRSAIVLALGGSLLWLTLRGRLRRDIALAALAVLVTVDMAAICKRYLNTDSFTTPQPTEQSFAMRPADRQILADTAQNYRVFDQQHFTEAMPSYYHKCIGGYHAAKLTRYQDLIDRQINQGNAQVLNMLNTKYIIASDTAVYVNPDALGNAWWADTLSYTATADEEMAALNTLHTATQAVADRQFEGALGHAAPKTPGDTIYETTYAPNRLTYHARSAHGGIAIFSEIYFPWGWQATIDGNEAPIGRANYVLRALRIPAGTHTVEFQFRPQTVERADTIATIAIVLIYLLIIAAANTAALKALRRRRTSE